ncbi:MAG: prolipoprotein diacylglyceryl transferase [Ruminococcus sp.]|nr:prolipoprotein diacylglyceryl transferase [Ruminococcus sp.]
MENFHVVFPYLGWHFDISRVAFQVGTFKIYWYGVIIMAGLFLAIFYAYKNAARYNVNWNKLFNCVLVGIVTGVIGARLYFCIFHWEEYFVPGKFGDIIKINEGGLAIYGGIIGALLGGLIVAKIQKMKIMPILDVTMISFLIGQGIGRWGNFMNQEAYGTPTGLPWAMMSEGTNNIAVHPCFLYESLWCLLGFFLLHFYGKYRQRYAGQIFYMYLVWYGFERTIVEGLRTDSLYLPFQIFGMDVRVSQLLSAILVVVGLICLIINIKREDPFYANYRRKKGVGKRKRKSKA